ncbi:hypothetical protein [Winogradskyella sp. A2]|uniref:hypothetical protein n=1 Tax=Winogradskyella sp. A2 TaxID=3366944 RepID=UPI00398C4959
MKNFLLILFSVTIVSCIPVRIAPKYKKEGFKIKKAKNFKHMLPKEMAYIFKDSKDENEFYNFINTKFQLNNIDVDYDVPFQINDKYYFITFYEVEIPDKSINILPMFVDVLTSNNIETDLSEVYFTRKGNWYIVAIVLDDESENCLNTSYQNRKEIILYLNTLRQEYLNTKNYEELLFAKKS